MAGGLMQLVAYGAQDVYLTGNPKVTFFQAVYKRHTNFAMETIEQTVNGTAGNSGRVSVTIARNGDLVGDMYVELKAIDVATGSQKNDVVTECWVAERAIASAELSIGGQRIDKCYQKWWRLYSELYLNTDAKSNWGKMTSGDASTVYLPLIFFFNRNPGLALPLIALQYHEVRIDFDLASKWTTYMHADNVFKVWANYIYLDTEERRRFAQKGHEYLIEQVQHTGADTVTVNTSNTVRLSYNHPVKEIVWCISETDTDDCAFWNFTGQQTRTVALFPEVKITDANVYVAPSTFGAPLLQFGTDAPLTNFTEEGTGTVTTAKLVLNGQDRMKAQSGKYYNQVQPYQHHSGSPMPGIYSYSFALKPEEHQPTGTCNFSRIDNAQFTVDVANRSGLTSLNMFAVNYNVLRVQSGMGGLAFSN